MNQEDIEKKKELLKYYYCEKHYGQDKCAKMIGPGIGRTTIKKWLREMNLPIRSFEEGKAYWAKNKKEKQEDYFQQETANMAWILGFLASDGTVSSKGNSIKIGLSRKDEEILEKIRQEISIENKVSYYTTNKGYDVAELQWTCEQHKKDLQKYGIVPRKTYNLKPPRILSREYYLDFFRGYFDGDGCLTKKQDNYILSIGSCTKEILEWMINFLYEDFNIPKVNILEDHRNAHIYYYFNYSKKSAKKICDLMYQNDNSLRLERKYLRYKEYFLD